MREPEGGSLGYEYTGRDLLEGPPEHYMYSAFGGIGFLRAYATDRKCHLRRMTPAEGVGEPGPEGLAEALGPREALPEAGHPEDIDTMELLRRLARTAAEPIGARHPAFGFWADVIVRKFEVSKRLWSRYGPDLRVADRHSVPLDGYAFAAFAVAARMRDGSTHRLLNCLLKLNDHVCASTQPLSPDARIAAAAALSEEIARVRQLAESMKIAFEEPSREQTAC